MRYDIHTKEGGKGIFLTVTDPITGEQTDVGKYDSPKAAMAVCRRMVQGLPEPKPKRKPKPKSKAAKPKAKKRGKG